MANGGKYAIGEILSWRNHTSILLASSQPVLASTYIATCGQTAFSSDGKKSCRFNFAYVIPKIWGSVEQKYYAKFTRPSVFYKRKKWSS